MSGLSELGIRLQHERPGEHRAACPECARSKERPRDEALAVKIEAEGSATWFCHRCQWRGAVRPPGEPQRRVTRVAASSQPPEPALPRPPVEVLPDEFERCWPITPDCIAGHYLVEARGCALPNPDGDLRWHPRCRHPSRHKGPALVALVTDVVTAEPMTLHKTWLMADGSGKARLDKPRLLKKGYGKKGGVVRLWPDEEVSYGLCIAEGIETALTAAHGFTPVWATLDANNLASFPVLAGIEGLTVVVDHDRVGIDAFNTVGARWLTAGVEVRKWLSDENGSDINDWAGAAA